MGANAHYSLADRRILARGRLLNVLNTRRSQIGQMDLRIGQLIENALVSSEMTMDALFYLEDDDLAYFIERYLDQHRSQRPTPPWVEG